MKIISIFDFQQKDENWDAMLYMWVKECIKYKLDICIYYSNYFPQKIKTLFPSLKFIKHEVFDDKSVLTRLFNKGYDEYSSNILNCWYKKSEILISEKEPFLYLDIDCVPFYKLDDLLEITKNMQICAVDNKKINVFPEPVESIQAGMILCNDNSLFKRNFFLSLLDSSFEKLSAPSLIPFDEITLTEYLNKENINYKHKDIDYRYNALSFYTSYNTYNGLKLMQVHDDGWFADSYFMHYCGTKPWQKGCLVYNMYRKEYLRL